MLHFLLINKIKIFEVLYLNHKLKLRLGSFLAGVCNGVFGAGGGILIIPILESIKLKNKTAHATSVAVMATFSLFSFIGYYLNGYFNFQKSIWFLPSGIVGAIVGAFILKKIKIKTLKQIFGILILLSSIRLLLK